MNTVSIFVILLVLAIIFFILKSNVLITRSTFVRNLSECYNEKEFPISERKQKYKDYKKALKLFDKFYTSKFNYISKDHKQIFKCKYLVKEMISSNLLNEYENECKNLEDLNIKEEAVVKIKECFKKVYVFKSAIKYFENHIDMATKTIDLISKNKRGSHIFQRPYRSLVYKRVNYLENVIKQCENVIDYLELKLADLEDVITKLKKLKKPTLLEIAFNVVTAPIKHTFNLVDSVISGDESKFIRSASMIGLTFLGVGIIGEAIDALDALEASDLSMIEGINTDIHHVDSHAVESYMREDGTFVSGYERGGENGYYSSNPDNSLINNLRS
ncbi:hypothetical protein [Psychrobacillus sp. NPDC093180]|uniref:hypothetical protein n=1 Tax=Psychrobacillus sp. NPDC093180 TaxID=3364489 RepID=UPI003809E16D